jgi:hypothetical protein
VCKQASKQISIKKKKEKKEKKEANTQTQQNKQMNKNPIMHHIYCD